ncbi:MAG TPA: VOC family protein [Coleofasciculaceae cyanobacterium]
MKIERIDHLVLTVHDLNRTCNFYSHIFGMEVLTLSGGRKALRFGEQTIKLHVFGQEFEPKALNATRGSADLCLITKFPLSEAIQYMKSHGIEILEGPVQRIGAIGRITSIYLRDPDGNLIEVSNYLDHKKGE